MTDSTHPAPAMSPADEIQKTLDAEMKLRCPKCGSLWNRYEEEDPPCPCLENLWDSLQRVGLVVKGGR